MLKFELISLYGRIFLQSRKPNFKSHKKNVSQSRLWAELSASNGGHNIINADFFSHLKPYKTYSIPQPQWQLDMRYPFQCPNNVFDGIFCEHTLEHFSIDDVSKDSKRNI
ncbi:MAG: hypothetical protein J1E28_06810 [Helicobacter sp.]|uniref:hypothetical protein n=1 Tax=Helicobacter sp. TaxID=218 RepID=UPI0025BAD01D|nr:hypothetical protein [Helicobacter sp.]MCH5314082.1 hypothetical protein [Helicobacter sp.]